ncbi:MAG: LWR-salt protein [Haloferacaceae archaeon]
MTGDGTGASGPDGRDGPTGDAAYVFRVRFRPDPDGVRLDPATFEATLERPADPPGTDGWLFFRDRLWRGEVGDEAAVREWAERRLGVPVVSVSFAELRTDEAYLAALREAVAADLAPFNADDADAALTKYLGSSIHVRPGPDG